MSRPGDEAPPPHVTRLEATARGHARVLQAARDINISIRADLSTLVVTLVVLGALLVLLMPEEQLAGSRSGLLRRIAAASVVAVVSALALRIARRRWRRARLRSSPELRRRLAEQLDEAAERLAHEVRARCEREEAARRLSHPRPLAVHWLASAAHSDHWANVREGRSDEPLDLSGDSRTVAALYARVPSGRLLVLGPAGSGKSVLAHRLVLDLLARRQPGAPVPVILPLASWNPPAQGFAAWAARRLATDHPALAAPSAGGDRLAGELLAAGRLLLVLDGFDEIRPSARSAALTALRRELRPSDRFVVTSRIDEYEVASRDTGSALPGTAALLLQVLPFEEAARYLRHSSGTATVSVWNPVLARLAGPRPDPQARAVRGALSTPLGVALARAAYSDTGRDPAELLDPRRFPDSASIEQHLLDRLVPALYADRPEETQRHLSYFAARMESRGEKELAWWRLGEVSQAVGRTVGAALALGVAVGAVRYLLEPVRVDLWGGGSSELPLWEAGALLALLSVLGLVFAVPAAPRRLRRPTSPAGLLLIVVASLLCGGLAAGLVLGNFLAIPAALFVIAFGPGIPRQETTTTAGAREALRADRRATAASLGLVNIAYGGPWAWQAAGLCGLPVILLAARQRGGYAVEAGDWAVAVGAAVVALVLLGVVLSASSAYTASRIWPWLTSRLPWDVAGLVDVAHRRGVLRQNGAAYRFGHLSLQQRLAAQGGHVPAHRAAAVTARRAGRVLRVAGTTTVGALLFIGASGISTVVEGLPAPPGPRTMPSACALLTGADFQQVLGGDFVQGQFTTHAKCAWSHERDPARGWPSVYLDVEAHGPFLGKSGTQDAKSDFEAAVQYLLDPKPFPGSSRLLHHVVGLGDEAVTKVGNTGVVIVKARADNLIFDLTLAPAATEESFTTEDDTLRNADLAERLLYTALTRLGPPDVPPAH
ncbi:NACHT domain-containing protein [Kitasatospora aburaviensis]|uniref:NACHT domain-containing protein n=1 Tax=Kitasatospora aburaviensis TaxID=67265 RepID=A0ABW1F5S5_9ACTN